MKDVIAAIVLMTTLFALLIYYIIPMPIEYALVSAFVVTMCTVMLHEFVHMVYAEEICKRQAYFTTTRFAMYATLISIVILFVLIVLKEYTGWYIYLVPIVASPGVVYVVIKDSDRCYDNIAIVAPFANMVVGFVTLMYLFTVSEPPFPLNDVSNFTVSLVALVSFFSFTLAFFNAIPIKIGEVATDGYWAMTVDKSDLVTKTLTVFIMFVSFCVLFMSRLWVIV